MKIVIFTTKNYIYSNVICREIIKQKYKDIILIVESNIIFRNKSFYQSMYTYFKKVGFKYFLNQAWKHLLFRSCKTFYWLFGRRKEILSYPFEILADRYGIKRVECSNINNPEFVKYIQELQCDVIVSALCNQIFDKALLKVPFYGCINFHPALLPNYRGSNPIFWALLNEEKEIGVTVHYMTEQIDAGEIIAQERIKVTPGDSENSLYIKACVIGGRLIADVLNKMEVGIIQKKHQNIDKFSYFSFPTPKDIEEFLSKGYKFFNIREFFKNVHKF